MMIPLYYCQGEARVRRLESNYNSSTYHHIYHPAHATTIAHRLVGGGFLHKHCTQGMPHYKYISHPHDRSRHRTAVPTVVQ